MTVHVLIVHYNTAEMVCRLVASIPPRTRKDTEVRISVLDNRSRSEQRAILVAGLKDSRITALHLSDKNTGFGAGMNALARLAAIYPGDQVWILNPDIELTECTVSDLENSLLVGEFDVIAPEIATGLSKDKVWYSGGTVDERVGAVRHINYGDQTNDTTSGRITTEFVTGASMYMTAEAWWSVGGFSESYFLYWEDVDWCRRAREKGVRLGVDRSVKVWHAVGQSSSSHGHSSLYYYYMARNRFWYVQSGGGPKRDLWLGLGLPETLRIVARAGREPGRRRVCISAALRGTVRGICTSASPE